MKKIFAFLFAAAAMTAACSKEEINTMGEDSRTCTISAYVSEDGGTKVAVQDNETYISHIWKTGDEISVFDGTTNKEFTLSGGEETSKGTFTGDALTLQSAPFYAIYPYNSAATIDAGVISNVVFKATQTYTAGSYDKDAVVMVASTDNIEDPLGFKIASSFIEITLTPEEAYTVKTVEITSNDGTSIAGTGTVSYNSGTPTVNITDGVPTVTVDFGTSGLTMTDGTPYTFYVALPAVTLTGGVSVAITGSDNKMILKKSSTLTLPRNKVAAMPALTAVPDILNLSLANSAAVGLTTPETANCYVVNAAGTYAIPVNFKGNDFSASSDLVGLDATGSVVWNEFITVSNLRVYGNYMTFDETVNEGKQFGNAVVAVTKNEEIKWSWHIWHTDIDLSSKVQFSNEATTYDVLPAVLGSASKTADGYYYIGTYYQSGRKDPFPTTGSVESISWGLLTETITNPGKWVGKGDSPYTFCSDFDPEFWGDNSNVKTIYDPSPVGYRVMNSNVAKGIVASTVDETKTNGWLYTGINDATLFIPGTGTRYMDNGNLGCVDKTHLMIGCSYMPSGANGWCIRMWGTGVAPAFGVFGVSYGKNVICMRDL